MYIPSVVSQLINISVHSVYYVCLFGIFADVTESKYYVISLKVPTTSLMIAGAVWLCSNLGIVHILFHIYGIAYSTRDKSKNTMVTLWVVQSIAEMLWVCSHEKRLLIYIGVFVIYATEYMLRRAGITPYGKQVNQDGRYMYYYLETFNIVALFVLVTVYCSIYKTICNLLNSMYPLIIRLLRSSHPIINGYINRAISVGRNTNRDGPQATIGHNGIEGNGNTQNIGPVVHVSNTITQDSSLLPVVIIVLFAIIFFPKRVETTAETYL